VNNLARSNNTNLSSNASKVLSAFEGEHVSKLGYEFNFMSERWQLSGDISVLFKNIETDDHDFELGFRAALSRYAEEYSPFHVENMFKATRAYLKKAKAQSLTVNGLSVYKSQLAKEHEYKLGAVKGFWLSWFDWGFPGIDKEVADFLDEMVLAGNEKGKAVKKRCPYTGPLTELEQSSLLEWAANAFSEGVIDLTVYTNFIVLLFTGRRGIQIRSLRFCDLSISETRDGNNYDLRVPRAKQRGVGFREVFNPISITEELYLLLKCLVEESCSRIERLFSEKLSADFIKELPVFIEWGRVKEFVSLDDLERKFKKTPDYLHIKKSSSDELLRVFCRKSQAKSERTGDFICLNSRRFRYTKGTNLSRRGISGVALAHALDQSDTQNIGVYTENTSKNAEIINEVMADMLAPLAQAFAGKLIDSERDALRADDPHSRVKNERFHSVGNCSTHSFCASGYRACYTCIKFQPWRDAPHDEVLQDLLTERERQKGAGVSENVIKATDRLLLAVKRVVQLCEQVKDEATQGGFASV